MRCSLCGTFSIRWDFAIRAKRSRHRKCAVNIAKISLISLSPLAETQESTEMKSFSLTLSILFLLWAAPVLAQTAPQPAPDSPDALKLQIERQQRRLQDWPQLSRYHDANAKVAPPEKGEERVVFLGDSITDG